MTEKPRKYKCCFCDAAFSRSEHRSRHERSHTKERPFHCQKCPSAFVRRDLLLRHNRTVHGRSGNPGSSGQIKAQPRGPSARTDAPGHSSKILKMDTANSISSANSSNSNINRQSGSKADQQLPEEKLSGDDFNAAVLMTELHQSFHKQQQPQTQSLQQPPPPPPHLPTQQYSLAGINITASGPQSPLSSVSVTTQQQNVNIHYDQSRYTGNYQSSASIHHESVGTDMLRFESRPSILQEYATKNSSNRAASQASFDNEMARPNFDTPQFQPSFTSINSKSNNINSLNHNDNRSGNSDNTNNNNSTSNNNNNSNNSNNASNNSNSNNNNNNINDNDDDNNKSNMNKESIVSNHFNMNSPALSTTSDNSHRHLNCPGATMYGHMALEYVQAQIPQFPDSFSIQSIVKYFDETSSKSMASAPPTKLQLNRYLATFFTTFHPHLPFLHLPTFDPTTIPPSLLFSVCSLGALLCHENNMANALHQNSKMLVNSISEINKDLSGPSPIWATQSLILNLIYSSWSGDPRGLEYLTNIRTSLATLVTRELSSIVATREHNQQQLLTWRQWLNEEICRRTYFAAYILFGSLGAIFNYVSPLDLDNDIALDALLPCREVLWNSVFSSEVEWSNAHYKEIPVSLREGFRSVDPHNGMPRLDMSPFAWRVISTKLFFQASKCHSAEETTNVVRGVDAWFANAKDNFPGKGSKLSQMTYHSSLFTIADSISPPGYASFSQPKEYDLSVRIRELQHPLLIDASIFNLITEIRLNLDLNNIKDVIRYHVPHEIANVSINTLAVLETAGKLSTVQMTSLVRRCFDLLRIPCLLGVRLIKSIMNSPLMTSSIETLLYGFEIFLVVVFWCYHNESIAHNSAGALSGNGSPEQRLYQYIEAVCSEAGLDRIQGRLSPSLALLGADILEGAESWGLANVLSLSLRSLAYNLFPERRIGVPTIAATQSQSHYTTSSAINSLPKPGLMSQQTFPIVHPVSPSEPPGSVNFGPLGIVPTTGPETPSQLAPISNVRAASDFKDIKGERDVFLPLRGTAM